MTTATHPSSEKSLIETALGASRDVTFVASLFLIFTGVVFRHTYFNAFDMPPSVAEASLYTVLLDAYGVLVDHAFSMTVIALLIVLAFLLAAALLRRSHLPAQVNHGLLAALAALVVVVSFPALATAAQDTAAKRAALVRGRYLVGAKVHIRSERAKVFPSDVLLDSSSVSVIGETDRELFVLYQPKPTKANPRIFPDARIYAIPREAIDFVESNIVAATQLTSE